MVEQLLTLQPNTADVIQAEAWATREAMQGMTDCLIWVWWALVLAVSLAAICKAVRHPLLANRSQRSSSQKF